jgi:hypothetical protein
MKQVFEQRRRPSNETIRRRQEEADNEAWAELHRQTAAGYAGQYALKNVLEEIEAVLERAEAEFIQTTYSDEVFEGPEPAPDIEPETV